MKAGGASLPIYATVPERKEKVRFLVSMPGPNLVYNERRVKKEKKRTFCRKERYCR